MKTKIILILALSCLCISCSHAQVSNNLYDSTLAKKLDADKYGMKSYILVILKTGPSKRTEKHFMDSCFAGHMSNMERLVKDGKLIVAGPISKNENKYRGIFILNAKTIEEGREIIKSDPAIKEGLLAADLYKWYGSAALPLYLEHTEKIWMEKP